MKPILGLFAVVALASAQAPEFRDLFNGKDLTGWVNVNTDEKTWSVKDGLLICSGHPIGVMRSEKQYENFILQVEWMHMEPGGTPECSSGAMRSRMKSRDCPMASRYKCSNSTG